MADVIYCYDTWHHFIRESLFKDLMQNNIIYVQYMAQAQARHRLRHRLIHDSTFSGDILQTSEVVTEKFTTV